MEIDDHTIEPETELNGSTHCLICRLPVYLIKPKGEGPQWRHGQHLNLPMRTY